ncbi:MAG: preprotein translocase subunit SecE [Firmicutes bacterium]|nr:preprotein translocase subunit SecE [Bacillota bacterium]
MSQQQPQQSRTKRIGLKTKALFGELRKVTYPSAKQVLKQTSIVLAVVIFFLLTLLLQDVILQMLYRLLLGIPVFPLFQISNLLQTSSFPEFLTGIAASLF